MVAAARNRTHPAWKDHYEDIGKMLGKDFDDHLPHKKKNTQNDSGGGKIYVHYFGNVFTH